MDKSANLSDCRQLLRRINCEAVIDTSDQNLYDILIRSEEKKTALLSWLLQNLFIPSEEIYLFLPSIWLRSDRAIIMFIFIFT